MLCPSCRVILLQMLQTFPLLSHVTAPYSASQRTLCNIYPHHTALRHHSFSACTRAGAKSLLNSSTRRACGNGGSRSGIGTCTKKYRAHLPERLTAGTPHLRISSMRRRSAAPSTPAAHNRQSKRANATATPAKFNGWYLHVSQPLERQQESDLLKPLLTHHARKRGKHSWKTGSPAATRGRCPLAST